MSYWARMALSLMLGEEHRFQRGSILIMGFPKFWRAKMELVLVNNNCL